jgi:hypothetical protein
MFERTAEGISNSHIFFNVDFVIYCEGAGDPNRQLDAEYWSKIWSLYGPNKQAKIVERGSKSDLIEIANQLSNAQNNALVAVDRDFDPTPQNIHVITTYGRTYEADIICASALYNCINNFCLGKVLYTDFRSFYDELVVPQFQSLCKIWRVESCLHSQGISLFEGKPLRYFKFDHRGVPSIHRDRILSRLKEVRPLRKKQISLPSGSEFTDFRYSRKEVILQFVRRYILFERRNRSINTQLDMETVLYHLINGLGIITDCPFEERIANYYKDRLT